MIGKLVGTVSEIESNYILLDTGSGINYKVYLPAIVLKSIKGNQSLSVYTHFHVRENEISLYGFPDKEFLRIFNLLISIANIGPKSALNIIGFDILSKLIDAVHKQETNYFAQIPGIGKKSAQKILLELSNKFDLEFKPQKKGLTQDDQTVIDALLSLGFQRHEAFRALEQIDRQQSLETQITQAIRNLAPHGK